MLDDKLERPGRLLFEAQPRVLDIALLSDRVTDACRCAERLLGDVALPTWPRTRVRLHGYSWRQPLPGFWHELHVLDAAGLPAGRAAELAGQTAQLNLHWVGASAGAGAHDLHWSERGIMLAYLRQLFSALEGRSFFGLGWSDYLQHLRQPGRRRGLQLSAGGWREGMCQLQEELAGAGRASSLLLFVAQRLVPTFGDYVTICDELERCLPADCLLSLGIFRQASDAPDLLALASLREACG